MENQMIINNLPTFKRGRPRLEEVAIKYWENNKDHVANYNKIYYQNNKDKHKLCREEVTCECGKIILKSTIYYHNKSQFHIKVMSKK